MVLGSEFQSTRIDRARVCLLKFPPPKYGLTSSPWYQHLSSHLSAVAGCILSFQHAYNTFICSHYLVGAMLFSSMCLAGTSVFAVGLYFKGTSTMFPLFLLGRILFG